MGLTLETTGGLTAASDGRLKEGRCEAAVAQVSGGRVQCALTTHRVSSVARRHKCERKNKTEGREGGERRKGKKRTGWGAGKRKEKINQAKFVPEKG